MSIAGIVHDITGCLAQERKYSRVIYTTSSPIFGVDTLGHVNIWNECTSRLIGYSTEKVMGQSLVQDVIPNNFKGAVKVWNQCVIGCVGVYCGIGRSRHYSLPDLVGWLRFLHVGCQDNQDSVVMSLHCGCSRLWPETKAMSPFTSHVGFLVLGYAKHHVFLHSSIGYCGVHSSEKLSHGTHYLQIYPATPVISLQLIWKCSF